LFGLAGAATPDQPSASKSSAALKEVPENVDDLRALQTQVKAVLAKVLPCTVGVRIGQAQGSGVIVSKDGYVLTAGHVSGQPDREITIVLPSGKTVKAKTLGSNQAIDSGLIKITEEGDWPFVEMGNSGDLKRGQWCIAAGHPGGFKKGRTPVVRLGRVLFVSEGLVRTDCAIVGGDSGGPLFDLDGKVIGIHSRISNKLTENIHVPVDTYRNTWDRMVKGEVWGGRRASAFLGVERDPNAKDCRIAQVIPGSPAEKAGLQADDVIVQFDGHKIASFDDLIAQVARKRPGDEVVVEALRGEATVSLRLKLTRQPS
jgi:serine protease Do